MWREMWVKDSNSNIYIYIYILLSIIIITLNLKDAFVEELFLVLH